MSHQGSILSHIHTYLYDFVVELKDFNSTEDNHRIKVNVEWKVHSFAGVSINWVGGRSTSWVTCQKQHIEGSSEVTLAASGRKAGTNKRVSVNDSLLLYGYQTIHCQYAVFNVPDLTF